MREWRVVIVEDDRVVAGIHCRLLRDVPGFDVVGVAETAEEAIPLISNLRPHLLLLDLALPGRDGLSLLRALRASGRRVEVIAVTASRSPQVVRDTAQLGVIDYLVKPFTPERLRRALALFRRRMQASRSGQLRQTDVDELFESGRASSRWLPKDLKGERIEQIRAVLAVEASPMSAAEVARRAGIARVTARRYLEYLVTIEEARVESISDGPGRPRKAYGLKEPIGAPPG